MVMERGPYTVAAVLDETEHSVPLTLSGRYIDLYSARLDIAENPVLAPGSVGLYYNLSKLDPARDADILAAAARISRFTATARSCKFTATANEGSGCVVRLYVRRPPKAASAVCAKSEIPVAWTYDAVTSTVLFEFKNSPEGVQVRMSF